jgi:hypothetical protein
MQADKNPGYVPNYREPDAVVGGCIEIFENVISNPEVIIESLEKLCADPDSGISWNKATTIGNGIWQDRRTNLDLSLTYYLNSTENSDIKSLHNVLYHVLIDHVTSYHRRYDINQRFLVRRF